MILKTDKTVPRNQRAYQDVNNWPRTEQVFNAPKLDFDNHQWIQMGYEIIDNCPNCPKQGIAIPSGKMLVKKDGRYDIIDEPRG
jgi:hypothetical protein